MSQYRFLKETIPHDPGEEGPVKLNSGDVCLIDSGFEKTENPLSPLLRS